MNRHFIYFENCEGGMTEHHLYDPSPAPDFLYRWMGDRSCKAEDTALLNWMVIAEIGDYKPHRLGTMVRIKDA